MTPPSSNRERAYRRLAAVILELDVESLTRRLEAERASSGADLDVQPDAAAVGREAAASA